MTFLVMSVLIVECEVHVEVVQGVYSVQQDQDSYCSMGLHQS